MADLFDLWSRWFDGQTVSNETLWGIKVLYWGRIGKALQFVGSLAILAEIIGSDRLRAFGTALHGTMTFSRLRDEIANAAEYIDAMRAYTKAKDGTAEKEVALAATTKFRADNIHMIISLGLLLYFFYLAWVHLSWVKFIFAAIAITMLMLAALVTILPYFTLAVIAFVLIIALLVDLILIEPIAWSIDRPALDKWIKSASLLSVIVGFHFDLLAS